VIVKHAGKLVAIKCTPKVLASSLDKVLAALRACIVANGQQGYYLDLVSVLEGGYMIVAKTGGIVVSSVVDGSALVGSLDFDAGLLSDGAVLEYTIVELI